LNKEPNRLQELLYKELLTPEKLSIPDILGSKRYNSLMADALISSIAERKQKEFDELLKILGYGDKEILKLHNSYKIGIVVNTLIKIYRVTNGRQ
jgi:hypothetical protein